jgi:hypothetical protein
VEIRLVIVDAMTFSYLKGLGTFELLPRVGSATHKLAVSKTVLMQVHRSGQLGSLVQSYCDRGEIRLVSQEHNDSVSRSVANVLQSRDAGLVRKNRADVELIEIARANKGAVLTRENGIVALAKRRSVLTLDILDFLAWGFRLELLSESAAEQCVAKWNTEAAAGTGAPGDWKGTLAATLRERAGLDALIQGLSDSEGSSVDSKSVPTSPI